jgi:hypothetical protein
MKTYARRIMAITSVAAIVIGTTSALTAQGLDTRANVPFAFTAGTTSLPAGTYNLSTLPGHTDAFMIRSLLHGVIILSQQSGSSRKDVAPALVFDRYGDQYFLREIRLPDNVAFELPKTSAENAAAKRVASAARPAVVVVLMGQ